MLKRIDKETVSSIKNDSFRNYAQLITNVEDSTLESIESFGLPLEEKIDVIERKERLARLREKQANFRNDDKSIYINGISDACIACQTGTGSYTSFVSLKCHRDCYFCFNTNQEDYEYYLSNKKDAEKELIQLLDSGYELKHLALTGGEPLLFKEDTVSYFQLAHEKSPESYTRLYTAGDLVTEDVLEKLKAAGLNEIRFSIKMEDHPKRRNRVLRKLALAQKYIPNVLVEMPVIPGTDEDMKELLLTLDGMGIFGINLLEFCFPLENAEAFNEEGLTLKNPPYEVYYNYWYAGGLAVAGSEELCLDLVEFSIDQGLSLGVHYCSLENKFTGQIYQQNHDQKMDSTYEFSTTDYYLKTAKAFGEDINKVKEQLINNDIYFQENDDHHFIQFPASAIHHLEKNDIEIAITSSVVENRMNENVIREVCVDWTTPSLFTNKDITLVV